MSPQIAYAVALVAVIAAVAVFVISRSQVRQLRTQLAAREDELKVQLAFHRAMMDTLPGLIMLKDADARIYDCNRAYQEAFGFDIGKLKGRTLRELEFYPPDVRERMFADDKAMLAMPGKVVHNETRLPFLDGQVHDMLYWKTAFLLPDGRLGGLLGVMVDITDLKKLEAAALEAKQMADQANRAKSSFLATMSHEIRTPMNAVLGMLELVALTKLDDEQRRMFEVVRESSKSLLRIIDDILDFSKIEAGKLEIKPETTSVARVVDSVFLVYVGLASSKNLLLKKNIDPRVSPALHADPLRLRQILNNFVSNALKFTEQGEVEIGVEFLGREDGRERVRFKVRDTGIGIPEDKRAKLFQAFTQAEDDTTRRFGGTGLGLAICRRLAELMGGEVGLESTLGAGTTLMFTASFPIADPADLAKAPASSPALQQAIGRRRGTPTVEEAEQEGSLILLADDHPTNRLLLMRQLATLGYASEATKDGLEALEKWKSGRFALLITDCHMPEMDGYQLAREIRRLEASVDGGRTPIIACTANALHGEAQHCFEAGMDDYVPKPVEMRELLAKLDQWLPVPGGDALAHASVSPVEIGGSEPIVPGKVAEITGGDPAMEREILLDFRQSNREDWHELKRAIDGKDTAVIQRITHRMRGASKLVGAQDLASICEMLELAGRDKNMARAIEIWPLVHEELKRLDRYLQTL